MKKRIYELFVIFLIIGLFITAYQVEGISQTQQKLARFSIRKADLPDGWMHTGEDWNRYFEGEEHTVAFGVPDDTIIRLVHTVSAYQTETEAREAYPKWENDIFGSGAWEPWAEAKFVPLDPNDLYRFECLEGLSDTVGCNYLQLHDRLISYVLVNLDSKSMTFEQLNEILGILDKRLNKVSIDD